MKTTVGFQITFAVGGAVVLPLAGLIATGVLRPPGPDFVCHRLLAGAIQLWMLETTNGVMYPNVDGSSGRSVAVLAPYVDQRDPSVLRDYRYVAGLRSDDPENLILFYLREPSWRTWHGDTHWFRREKRWVVLNPRMSTPEDVGARGWSECGEATSTEQLKARLNATLDYLKREHRPGWQVAIVEHKRFLDAIKD